MIKLKKKDDSVLWSEAGLERPAPKDKRALKLALALSDLPPVRSKDKVVLP